MRLLQARQISALSRERAENGVGRRRGSVPVIAVETSRESVCTRNGGVKAHQCKIFADLAQGIGNGLGRSGGQVVLRWIGQLRPIGRGPEILSVRQHPHRTGFGGSNIGSRIWAPGRGFDNVARHQALASQCVRHVGNVRHVPPFPKSFIVSKQEDLVLLQRSSQFPSKLVPFERTLGGLEVVPRVQAAVAQILEHASMQLVRSRRRYDYDLSASPFSILGTVGVLEDVIFPHRVHAQQLPAGPRRRDELPSRV